MASKLAFKLAALLGVLARLVLGGSFVVKNDTFILNDEALRLVTCEIHYFRIPHEYWRDRLQRMKALGCNSIQIYVPWNFHEPAPGKWDFSGERDISSFVAEADRQGLYVLLRPGPYICAEWEMGGMPAWLLGPRRVGAELMGKLRTTDPTFLKYTRLYWKELFRHLQRQFVSKGGPILMVQIENEFGFWNAGGRTAYLEALRDIANNLLRNETLLYTTDPPWVVSRGGLRDGSVVNIVDFGVGRDVKRCFEQQRAANVPGNSPPMCSEFYTGWLTHWGEPMANTSAPLVATSLAAILAYGGNRGSVCLYMAHGGTNFAFWAGANGGLMDITSYDYDCPVAENGRTGQPGIGGFNKFQMLQRVITSATGVTPDPPPREPPIVAHGAVPLTQRASMADNLAHLHYDARPTCSEDPLTMEGYGMTSGMLEYRKAMRCGDLEGAWLKLRAYDYAVVRIAGVRVGSVWRAVPPHIHLRRHLCTDSERIVDLTITVAAYGRDNFFPTGTPSALNKGIVGAVELTYASGRRAPLQGWQVAVMPLVQPGRVLHWGDERAELPTHKLVRASKRMPYDSMCAGVWAHGARCKGRAEQAWWHAEPEDGPTFYRGTFTLENELEGIAGPGTLADTYLRTDGFVCGLAWVNGHNVGRYWTTKGPQQALFVPGVWLRAGDNEIVVLELELAPSSPHVTLVDRPDFSGGRAPLDGALVHGALLHGPLQRLLNNEEHALFFLGDEIRRMLGYV